MSRARAELYLSAPPWDSAPDNPQGEREAPVAAERPLNLTVFPEVSLLGGPSRLAWTTEPGLEAPPDAPARTPRAQAERQLPSLRSKLKCRLGVEGRIAIASVGVVIAWNRAQGY